MLASLVWMFETGSLGILQDTMDHDTEFDLHYEALNKMSDNHVNFLVDEVNSDHEYLYVDVPGYGTVVIKREVEGLIIDVYSPNVTDDPVATFGATFEELGHDNEE